MSDSTVENLKLQKRDRFHVVLEWERKQSEDSFKYRSILNNLINRLMQKVTNSRDANRAVIKFLHEKAKGYRVYSEILLSELTYLPDPPNENRVLSSPEPITPTNHELNENEKPFKSSSLRIGLSSVSEHQSSLSRSLLDSSQKIQ
jgi:hypothetical protein